MKNKLIFTILFLTGNAVLSAQAKIFSLSKANTFQYKKDLYIFGFTKSSGPADLIVYRTNEQLVPTDSLIIRSATRDVQTQLQCTADTLHNFINIYLYRNDKKVTILRFVKELKDYRKIEDVDVARLNNRAMFGEEVKYFKDVVYSISTQKDSSGVQFYLNSYTLTTPDKNFDYQKKWQFPFERKNIKSAHIIETADAFVAVFVNVIVANKNTQWVLRINAKTGQLIKGTRLNQKEENSFYQYGASMVDNNNKNILVCGIKHAASTLTVTAPATNTSITVFLMLTDSFGQIIQKQNFPIPVKHTESGASKTKTEYMLRPYLLTKEKDGKILLKTDVYRSGNYRCFYYACSSVFEITPGEENYVLKKTEISNLPQLESYYISPDKNDLNGKICPATDDEKETILFSEPVLPVKVQYKRDENGYPAWLLTKSSLGKKSINYSVLAIEGKTFKLKRIDEIEKKEDPSVVLRGENTFFISRQILENEYQVKKVNW